MEVRSGAAPKDDVFGMLIRANEEDGGKFPLSDIELVSRSSSNSLPSGWTPQYFLEDWERVSDPCRWPWYAFIVSLLVDVNRSIDWMPETETTAHTLAATLALLGLNQDIQDEVLQQILEIVGPTREPVG
jgi:hypothetical protein